VLRRARRSLSRAKEASAARPARRSRVVRSSTEIRLGAGCCSPSESRRGRPAIGEIQDRWDVRQASRAFVQRGTWRQSYGSAWRPPFAPGAKGATGAQEIGFAVLGRPPRSKSRGDDRVVADVSFTAVRGCFAAAAAAFGTRARRAPDGGPRRLVAGGATLRTSRGLSCGDAGRQRAWRVPPSPP
jgi:hypothetical protein